MICSSYSLFGASFATAARNLLSDEQAAGTRRFH
jgi:hypothetical protein